MFGDDDANVTPGDTPKGAKPSKGKGTGKRSDKDGDVETVQIQNTLIQLLTRFVPHPPTTPPTTVTERDDPQAIFGTYLASVCRKMHTSQWADFQMEVSKLTDTHTHTFMKSFNLLYLSKSILLLPIFWLYISTFFFNYQFWSTYFSWYNFSTKLVKQVCIS